MISQVNSEQYCQENRKVQDIRFKLIRDKIGWQVTFDQLIQQEKSRDKQNSKQENRQVNQLGRL